MDAASWVCELRLECYVHSPAMMSRRIFFPQLSSDGLKRLWSRIRGPSSTIVGRDWQTAGRNDHRRSPLTNIAAAVDAAPPHPYQPSSTVSRSRQMPL